MKKEHDNFFIWSWTASLILAIALTIFATIFSADAINAWGMSQQDIATARIIGNILWLLNLLCIIPVIIATILYLKRKNRSLFYTFLVILGLIGFIILMVLENKNITISSTV